MNDGLAASYVGAFDGHLPFGRCPALLLVDVVRAYVESGSPLHAPAFAAALTPIARLVGAARGAGVPVVFTRVVYQPGGVDGGLFYRKVPALKVFDEGSPLGGFTAAVLPRASEVIVTKHYASAFFGTSLASTLSAWGTDTLVVTGFSTSGCVRATALDALQYGFTPFVVRDACADRHAAPHDANLFDLEAKYAEVIDSASLVAWFGAST